MDALSNPRARVFRQDRFPEFFDEFPGAVGLNNMLTAAARYINPDYLWDIPEIEPGVHAAIFVFATPEEANRFWIFAHDMLVARMRRWAEDNPI